MYVPHAKPVALARTPSVFVDSFALGLLASDFTEEEPSTDRAVRLFFRLRSDTKESTCPEPPYPTSN